jgi:hypothetical protein
MNKRTMLILAIAVGVVMLIVGIAFAASTSYGPVTVVSAKSFTSNGSSISGWYWLRDAGLNAKAEWTFENLPTKKGAVKGNKIFLRFDPLVTNQANGGSGYDATVLITYTAKKGLAETRVPMKNNHPEIEDPRNTSGWGYSASGYFSIPVTSIPDNGKMTVVMKRYTSTKKHVAANNGACTIEYLKP